MKGITPEYVDDDLSGMGDDEGGDENEDPLPSKRQRTPNPPTTPSVGDDPDTHTTQISGDFDAPSRSVTLFNDTLLNPPPTNRLDDNTVQFELELVLQCPYLHFTAEILQCEASVRSRIVDYLNSETKDYDNEVQIKMPEFVSLNTWNRTKFSLQVYECLVRTLR